MRAVARRSRIHGALSFGGRQAGLRLSDHAKALLPRWRADVPLRVVGYAADDAVDGAQHAPRHRVWPGSDLHYVQAPRSSLERKTLASCLDVRMSGAVTWDVERMWPVVLEWDEALRADVPAYARLVPGAEERGSVLRPPATAEEVAAAEDRLGIQFPASYRSFLLISNGAEARPYRANSVNRLSNPPGRSF